MSHQQQTNNLDNIDSSEPAAKYLGTELYVTVTDSRIFNGSLACIDPDRNIILEQTWETNPQTKEKRYIGIVSIRGSIIEEVTSPIDLPDQIASLNTGDL